MSKFNRKMAMLMVLSSCTMAWGFSCDKLFTNMWRGFGYSLGGLPANIIANNIITPLLTSLGLTQTN